MFKCKSCGNDYSSCICDNISNEDQSIDYTRMREILEDFIGFLDSEKGIDNIPFSVIDDFINEY